MKFRLLYDISQDIFRNDKSGCVTIPCEDFAVNILNAQPFIQTSMI